MPGKKRKRASGKRKWTLAALAALALAALCLLAGMFVAARTLHIRHATVYLEDLPEAFDGIKILFLSDLDLHGANGPAQGAELMARLQALSPDLLLLGGDYASPSLWERLNGGEQAAERSLERVVNDRSRWIAALKDFEAPLGKFAVAGEADLAADSLKTALEAAGVALLQDQAAAVTRNGQRLAVLGLAEKGAEPRDLGRLSAAFKRSDCVLALVHNPSAFVGIETAEASDGGPWVDLALAGHTHGGQILLFGKSAFTYAEYEGKYLSGWRRENGVALLTSAGVGCTGANLRLGTEAEAHLITLKRGKPPNQN